VPWKVVPLHSALPAMHAYATLGERSLGDIGGGTEIMANEGVKLFLSCVSDEFSHYREGLRHALTLPNVEVKIQENFKNSGGDTLRTLADYVKNCETVIHFFGDMNGSAPELSNINDLLLRYPKLESRLAAKGLTRQARETLTYTQWEAWLAVGFDRDLVIVAPAESVPHSTSYAPTLASRTSQAEHINRLRAINRYPEKEPFNSMDNLVAQVFLSAVRKALVKAGAMPTRQPRNLPFASLNILFKGREAALDDLRSALSKEKGAAATVLALHGLGGVGKTRLAIEYALRHEADFSAILFLRADNPATLNASLAALSAAEVLDLPEKEARENGAKIRAVFSWLEVHPTWLMIIDNVDDDEAVKALTDLMARLRGGHVIVTARATNFPGSIRKLELGVLDEGAAVEFLLERTHGDREPAGDDTDRAHELAREVGGLPLGLEQAGAYVARQHIGFPRYLTLWREKRNNVLNWFDKSQMSYDHDVGLATTWATSVEKLTPESGRLLERLAFLATDLIPDSLIDVPVPSEAGEYDAYEARAGLYAYSLASQARSENGAAKGFVVHPLVQDFARRALTNERRAKAQQETLLWVAATFVGDPQDVRSWPTLDPLASHALTIARRADQAEIFEPTVRLFNQLGILFRSKARFAEAEPLFRRALAIREEIYGPLHVDVAQSVHNLAILLHDTNRLVETETLYLRALAISEASIGPDCPQTAVCLNSLGDLLRETNRPGEAEPIIRRALAINQSHYGRDHPRVGTDLNLLAHLLLTMNRVDEAEPLIRRALAIDESHYGPDHPSVAKDLGLLAELLRQTNRPGEAEPIIRRALVIDEASFGAEHPSLGIRLDNLAVLLMVTHRFEEAEQLRRRALRILEKSYGRDHPEVATCLSNLASLLKITNRLVEAEPLIRRALKIGELSFGPDHPKVAIRLNNLAKLLGAMDRLAEAEPLYRRALRIFERSLGPGHHYTVGTRTNLAVLVAALGRQV
jgi:tetratricopeptide (TPR) repeat protein